MPNQIVREPEPQAPLDLTTPQTPRAREALLKRLSEIVAWPESRIPAMSATSPRIC
jgi:hypothetical protein